MDDDINRVGPDRAFDVAPFGREELFLRSESPRVQEILLHKKLQEVIEKYPNKVRYVDSELHLKNDKRSQDSGLSEGPLKTTLQSIHRNITNASNSASTNHSKGSDFADQALERGSDSNGNVQAGNRQQVIDPNCQVCLIKEIRQGLMKMTKMVVERNVELKEKCIRSHFERQIMD